MSISKSLSIGVLCFILSACTSLDYKVTKHLTEENFLLAKIELQKKGVWRDIQPKTSEKDIIARSKFQKIVENHFKSSSNNLLKKGLISEAINEIDEGLTYVPWSNLLKQSKQKASTTYEFISSFKTHWMLKQEVIREEKSIAEEYLVKFKRNYPDTNEFQALQGLFELATETYIKNIVNEVEKKSPIETIKAYEEAVELINYSGLQINSPCLNSINKSKDYSSFTAVNDSFFILNSADKCRLSKSSINNTWQANFVRFDKLIEKKLTLITKKVLDDLALEIPTIHVINDIESNLKKAAISRQTKGNIKNLLVNFHIIRADELSGLGWSAYLALIHTSRARSFDINETKEKLLLKIESKAMNSLINSEKFESEFVINPSPEVDPTYYDIVHSMLSSKISNRSHELINWYFSSKGYTNSTRRIELIKVKYYSPYEGLNSINSSYYSHSIEVNNPSKSYLKSRVNSAKITMNSAEWSYDSAVNSYNIYPTTYSYNNVQYTYNTYVRALNNYNSLVNKYNATPSYITKNIYEPYTFYEGNISYGWEIKALVYDNNESYIITGRNVKNSFMRVGTKYNDKKKNYRKDHMPKFGIELDDDADSLHSALNEISDGLSSFVGNSIIIPYVANLDDLELDYLTALLHPWGSKYAKKISLPIWVSESEKGLNIELPSNLPEIHLAKSDSKSISSAKDGTLRYQNSIVRIISKGNSGAGSSSGVIIREDGLILTTAHGIGGRILEVDVLNGNKKGKYKSKVTYIDHRNDIAILSIYNGSGFDWVPIELSKNPVPGEKILAFGNPSITVGNMAISAVTEGTLSAIENLSWGSPRMVADITIASGSSGGAIVSMESGKLIGIVAAISSPEFKKDRAATGMFALLIPSVKFGEWLGLNN